MASHGDLFEDDFDEILMSINLDDTEMVTAAGQANTSSGVPISSYVHTVLHEVTPAFCFHTTAKDLKQDTVKVSAISIALQKHFGSCLITKSKLSGINREASQRAFYKKATSGLSDVTSVTGDHKLTMWLALEVFKRLLDAGISDDQCCTLAGPLSSEEVDIAHYIGGSVVSKLRKKKKSEEEEEVLCQLICQSEPEPGTLLSAKTRGKLTNITVDCKCMFVELEQVFRDSFPCTTDVMNEASYRDACCKNATIQDCFHSATYDAESTSAKEKVFMGIISLYFKVRVHHKAKIIVDGVRAKAKVSSKDKALRSKLAN